MGPLAVNPSLYAKLPYDPLKDFAPILRAVSALNVLVVHPSVPVQSVKDLIAFARANPGKLNYGSSGAGRADHLAGELVAIILLYTSDPAYEYRGVESRGSRAHLTNKISHHKWYTLSECD